MPRPRYRKTRRLPLREAWDVLASDGWELAERHPGGWVTVGQPPLRRPPGDVGAMALNVGPEPHWEVRIRLPQWPTDVTGWPDGDAARKDFEGRIATYAAQTQGEERLYRIELVNDEGKVADERVVATGEITDDTVLDPLSVTYFGVLASIVVTVGFGFGGSLLAWTGAAALGVALVLLGRVGRVRRVLTRLTGFGAGHLKSRDR